MEPLPSKSALVRIGKALAAGTETDDQLDQLDLLLAKCDEVRRRATESLADALEDAVTDTGGHLSVRGRTKTLVTLREKLERMGGHQLPVIRDLVGLRIVGDMTLDDQDLVLIAAASALGVSEDDVKVIDRREKPVRGYRALHGEISLDGLKVELQVRTNLQHEWAEVYEKMGDRFGRSVRYANEGTANELDRLKDEAVQMMGNISTMIREDEENNWAQTGRRLIDELFEEKSDEERPVPPPPQEPASIHGQQEASERLRRASDALRRLQQHQQGLLREMLATLSSLLEAPTEEVES